MIFATAADAFSSPLAQWGIPGFFIVVLSGVVVYLYKDNKRLNDLLLTTTREVLTVINNFVEVQKDRIKRRNE